MIHLLTILLHQHYPTTVSLGDTLYAPNAELFLLVYSHHICLVSSLVYSGIHWTLGSLVVPSLMHLLTILLHQHCPMTVSLGDTLYAPNTELFLLVYSDRLCLVSSLVCSGIQWALGGLVVPYLISTSTFPRQYDILLFLPLAVEANPRHPSTVTPYKFCLALGLKNLSHSYTPKVHFPASHLRIDSC